MRLGGTAGRKTGLRAALCDLLPACEQQVHPTCASITTLCSCSRWEIRSHTVLLPEAVPPATPAGVGLRRRDGRCLVGAPCDGQQGAGHVRAGNRLRIRTSAAL